MIGLKTGSRPLVRGIRTKGPAVINSGLELARIPEQHFQRWSEQVMDQPLPLKTFLSQHRPLLAVPRRQKAPGSLDSRDVMFVQTWKPRASPFEERKTASVPFQIAQDLGPFCIQQRAVGAPEQQPEMVANGEVPRHVQESVGVLAQFLDKYNREGNQQGALMHLPLHEGRAYLEFEGVDATSVRRKRKLKMNRHKYRKRLKEQRSLKRRLGK